MNKNENMGELITRDCVEYYSLILEKLLVTDVKEVNQKTKFQFMHHIEDYG